MPGRAFVGLSADEKHPSEFSPSPLPDEPKITIWLVAAAIGVALLVLWIGWHLHAPATASYHVHHGLCPNGAVPLDHGPACPRLDLRWWNRIPMTVWFVYAALAAGLVMTGPFIAYGVKRRTGEV